MSSLAIGLIRKVGAVRLRAAAPAYLAVLALALWWFSLRGINVRGMTDLGLISVMPMGFLLSLFIMAVSFSLSLRHPRPERAGALLQIVALILVLFATPALVEEAPRFAVTWLHEGFTEFVVRTGQVAPQLDARFNWPGFFILAAFMTRAAGAESALPILAWAPTLFNLLYLGPLVMILTSLTQDRRVVWLGILLFYVGNWVGQDYYAPQALGHLFYLVLLGILLQWYQRLPDQQGFWTRRRGGLGILSRVARLVSRGLHNPEGLIVAGESGQRVGLVLVIVVLFLALVSSHQLTPFFVLASVVGIVILDRCSLRGLPVLMGVMIAVWMSYMAVPFLAGHIGQVTGEIGQITGLVGSNVADRLRGSPEHVIVVYIRLLMTMAIWGLAALGAIRRIRRGKWDWAAAALAIAPFSLLALQSYGGEMLLRIYMITLPFAAYFIASLFHPEAVERVSWKVSLAVGLTALALLGGFLFSRYGNERMDYMTKQDVEAVEYVYRVAKPGSLLVAASSNLPWRYRDYEGFEYRPVSDEILAGDVDGVIRVMKEAEGVKAYLIITRSQEAYAELFSGMSADAWDRFVKGLTESGSLRLLFANQDAKVFTLSMGVNGDGP